VAVHNFICKYWVSHFGHFWINKYFLTSILQVALYLELYGSNTLNFGAYQIKHAYLFLNKGKNLYICRQAVSYPSLNRIFISGGVVTTIKISVSQFWVQIVQAIVLHTSGAALNLTDLHVALDLYGYCYMEQSVLQKMYVPMKGHSQFPFVLAWISIIVLVTILGFI
jgi:hypothetical protein